MVLGALLIIIWNELPHCGHPLNRGVEWVLQNQSEMSLNGSSRYTTLYMSTCPIGIDLAFCWNPKIC